MLGVWISIVFEALFPFVNKPFWYIIVVFNYSKKKYAPVSYLTRPVAPRYDTGTFFEPRVEARTSSNRARLKPSLLTLTRGAYISLIYFKRNQDIWNLEFQTSLRDFYYIIPNLVPSMDMHEPKPNLGPALPAPSPERISSWINFQCNQWEWSLYWQLVK